MSDDFKVVAVEEVLMMLPMNEVLCEQDLNCGRGYIPPASVIPLAEDIKARGLIHPVTVRTFSAAQIAEKPERQGYKYGLVAGYRRHLAHVVAKLTEIKSLVGGEMSDEEARKINYRENVQRQELNILQEARGLRPFLDAGFTREQICEELRVSVQWVQQRTYLLALPDCVQQEIGAGLIPKMYIRDLYTVLLRMGVDKMYEHFRRIKDSETVRDGQKKRVKLVLAKPRQAKRARTRGEIFERQGEIQKEYGNNLATRALAWAGGEITDTDLDQSVQDYGKLPSYQRAREIHDDICVLFGPESMECKIADFYVGLIDVWDIRTELKRVEMLREVEETSSSEVKDEQES